MVEREDPGAFSKKTFFLKVENSKNAQTLLKFLGGLVQKTDIRRDKRSMLGAILNGPQKRGGTVKKGEGGGGSGLPTRPRFTIMLDKKKEENGDEQ